MPFPPILKAASGDSIVNHMQPLHLGNQLIHCHQTLSGLIGTEKVGSIS